jgi:hypothetical protein
MTDAGAPTHVWPWISAKPYVNEYIRGGLRNAGRGTHRDHRLAVFLLELSELATVRDTRDDLSDIVRLPRVGRDDALQLARGVHRRLDLFRLLPLTRCQLTLGPVEILCTHRVWSRGRRLAEVLDSFSSKADSVRVGRRQMVRHAGHGRVHLPTACSIGSALTHRTSYKGPRLRF